MGGQDQTGTATASDITLSDLTKGFRSGDRWEGGIKAAAQLVSSNHTVESPNFVPETDAPPESVPQDVPDHHLVSGISYDYCWKNLADVLRDIAAKHVEAIIEERNTCKDLSKRKPDHTGEVAA